ncbi:helix-turn-helix transcriptional regulator [Brenneria goodwinii]|uniref:helix-turn-helix domain-containing protein n=1 Tax=Brenneria goodwinii TaxID=1109412 RepID=UPI00065E22EA|nr:helix-turn-helix transcriptional regulator [Brenneria goodwinii]MCG8156743.1 helix-turn-helix transcriptional regulator [Brenneria goodwinii]MCG8160223.1 helix-turn-helix transcriptional regulator [Brenneria goodwinii]MCG8164746.1 helix-turn-helix transcriptional regulator [Brenneria goodwinii]MCG8171576.1 helix-turn-helix transcriptional regulator [Brenneria goodwinii]MCG8174076.1 helix-turn-helix transcriptional regulator [Brenneria goodwinii]
MKTSDSIKVLLGRRVKALRLQAGLSQEAFAEKCGLDRTYISGIERGIRNPTLEVLYIIATGLHIDLAMLFAFHDPA